MDCTVVLKACSIKFHSRLCSNSFLSFSLMSVCMLFSVLVLESNLISTARAGGWSRTNDPRLMEIETGLGSFEYKFSGLPNSGRLSVRPWTDTYWPTCRGGIGCRWQGEVSERTGFLNVENKYFTKEEVMHMNKEDLMNLAPCEKFDVARCDYPSSLVGAGTGIFEGMGGGVLRRKGWTLTQFEDKRVGGLLHGLAERWTGLCHGWSAAALFFEEPGCINYRNRDGVEVPFVCSDIKGLLTFMQGECRRAGNEFFVGERSSATFDNSDFNAEGRNETNDINAGAFHVIMANRIGKLDKGFVLDVTTDEQVWNQPLEAFESSVIAEGVATPEVSAKGAVREVEILSDVTYTVEAGASAQPQNEADGEPEASFRRHKQYRYILELDKDDQNIGGRWITTYYPDFVWSFPKVNFPGIFMELKNIYEQSLKNKQ
ncbi:MAG: hypothetical protein HQK53_07675 [Oligoflexia bacterium]|nr:hypothetical protein [Oligoflexia bacterium]